MLKMYQGYTDEHRYNKGVRSEVDEDGELRVSAPAATHVVKSKKQIEAYTEHLRWEEGRKREFTFTHMDNIQEVIEKISDTYCGYLLFLQCFVNYNTILVNQDDSIMSREDMMKTLGLKVEAFDKFLYCMIKHEIIFTDKSGDVKRYKLNQRYHFRGKTDNDHVIKSFTTMVRELYRNVKPGDLGLVYKLLPYVHFETNSICSNPYEIDAEKIDQLSKSDIARLTGMTEKSVYSKLRRLKFNGRYVFAEIIRGDHRFYKIDPMIFYRRNGVPDQTLIEIFALRNNYNTRVHTLH